MELGKNLTILRKEKKLSRQKFSDMFGISVNTYVKYELCDVEPSYETLSKLADFYNVTVDFLLGRTNLRGNEDPLESLGLFPLEKAFLEEYLKQPKERRDLTMEFLEKAIKKVNSLPPE